MRLIAIDLGDKRTGIAVADTVLRRAMPLKVVEVGVDERGGGALLDALAREVDALVGSHEECTVVVGLPLNMDGTEGPRARQVRAWGARIGARLGLGEAGARRLTYQDERLTSAQADWDMARSGLTHAQKKARRDALAAAALLQDFLDAGGPS
ncbi:MAG: Holliday junction resolvase RuvX [Phycisphaerales bacterium]